MIKVPPPGEDQILQALTAANERGVFPTTLDTAGLRNLAAQVRARAVFTARGANVHFVSMIKRVIDELAAGKIGRAGARVALLETLRALGYTPEGGFPDTPEGAVPEAIQGTLQDLSSRRRLDLIVRTQIELAQGAGQQVRGQSPERMAAFPAWELVRYEDRSEPRDWQGRFEFAGGKISEGGRMIAFKGDPVWGELGASANFEDALDTDHPPFAFNSGMGGDEVPAEDVERLGVTGPQGETIEEWLNGETIPQIRGELKLPAPSLSMRDAEADLVKAWQEDMGAVEVDADPDRYDFDALLEEELREAAEAYDERGAA